VFGYFLHHYPHIGLGDSAEEDQQRIDSGDRMRELYETTFGDAYPGWYADAASQAADNAHATDMAGAVAFSAGPSHDKLKTHADSMAGAVAFSAGPSHDKLKTHAASMAGA